MYLAVTYYGKQLGKAEKNKGPLQGGFIYPVVWRLLLPFGRSLESQKQNQKGIKLWMVEESVGEKKKILTLPSIQTVSKRNLKMPN